MIILISYRRSDLLTLIIVNFRSGLIFARDLLPSVVYTLTSRQISKVIVIDDVCINSSEQWMTTWNCKLRVLPSDI